MKGEPGSLKGEPGNLKGEPETLMGERLRVMGEPVGLMGEPSGVRSIHISTGRFSQLLVAQGVPEGCYIVPRVMLQILWSGGFPFKG